MLASFAARLPSQPITPCTALPMASMAPDTASNNPRAVLRALPTGPSSVLTSAPSTGNTLFCRKLHTASIAGFSTFSHTPASISSDSFTPASQTLINASSSGKT